MWDGTRREPVFRHAGAGRRDRRDRRQRLDAVRGGGDARAGDDWWNCPAARGASAVHPRPDRRRAGSALSGAAGTLAGRAGRRHARRWRPRCAAASATEGAPCSTSRPSTRGRAATCCTRRSPIRSPPRRIARLYARLAGAGPVALFDPEDVAGALAVMHPDLPPLEGLYVQDVQAIGRVRAGSCRAAADRPAAVDCARPCWSRRSTPSASSTASATSCPPAAEIVTLDDARIPEAMLTNPRRYLDRLNFATNYAFFREAARPVHPPRHRELLGRATARAQVRLWLRLFDAAGAVLAEWERGRPARPRRHRDRQRRGARALRACRSSPASFSSTRSAPPATTSSNTRSTPTARATTRRSPARTTRTPGRRTAMPASPPRTPGERVVLWVQNSHAVPIPPGGLALDRMGAEQPVALDRAGRAVRHRRARRGRTAARPALAGADRGARGPPRRAAALRGDARRAHPHRPRQCRARRPRARSAASRRCPRRWAAATCCRCRCCRARRFAR